MSKVVCFNYVLYILSLVPSLENGHSHAFSPDYISGNE